MESVLNSFQEGKWCGEVDEIRRVMVMHLVLEYVPDFALVTNHRV